MPETSPTIRRVRWMVRGGVALAVVLIGFTLLAGAAATGLVRIPGFGWTYQPPAPVRVVRTGSVFTPDEFRRLVETRIASSLRATPQPIVRVAFTESELTAFLRGSIQEALRDASVEARDLQVAVQPTKLEFSGRFRRGWLQLDVVAEASVLAEDDQIVIRMDTIRIGRVPASPETIQRLLSNVLSRDVGSFQIRVPGFSVRQVELFMGRLEIAIERQTL